MKAYMQSYPVLKQLKRRIPYFLLSPAERIKFSPYIGMAEGMIKSNPTVDYLCNTLLDKVRGMSLKSAGVNLCDSEGVLLIEGITLLYRVEKKNSVTAHVNLFIIKKVEILAHIKADVKNSKLKPTILTLSQDKSLLQGYLKDLIAFILFKRHVPVQEKEGNALLTAKPSYGSGNLEASDNYPVNIINELFFTSIVRDTPYPVKGHIRRYKSGKVAVIKSFKRKGYRRKAKKLSVAA